MASIIDIWGLQPALDRKAPTGHQHRISEIEGLRDSLDAMQGVGSSQPANIGDVNGLQDLLDIKLESDDLTGLLVAINEKAAVVHGHSIDAVTGLQTALDEKAATGHDHSVATPSADGFMSAADKAKLDGLSSNGGGPGDVAIADITGLQTILDAKAAINHTHALATTTAAGFLSPDDKIKLDGIAAATEPVLLTYTISQSSAQAPSTAGTYAKLTDGNLATGAGTTNAGGANWIKATFAQPTRFSRISVAAGTIPDFGSTQAYLNGCTIEISQDDTIWMKMWDGVISEAADAAVGPWYTFAPMTARYVRIRRTSNYVALTEFKIYG